MAGCHGTMADSGFIFDSAHISKMLHNQHVVVIGDSVQRCVYKDLVLAVQEDRLLSMPELQRKVYKTSFLGDQVRSMCEIKTNGVNFYESREFVSPLGNHLIHYYYVTKCYYDRVEGILEFFEKEKPDIVIMNSCIWDISRYGAKSEEHYLSNLATLLQRLTEVLPVKSMFVWLTTPPLSSHIADNQFLREEIQFLSAPLRKCVLEMNYAATQLVAQYGFDVLDINYYLRPLVDTHRSNDGVHWDAKAHRHITELLIMFLHDSLGVPLPQRSIDIMKKQNLQCLRNLKHLGDTKQPSFVRQHLNHLNVLADSLTPMVPEQFKSGQLMFPRQTDQKDNQPHRDKSGDIEVQLDGMALDGQIASTWSASQTSRQVWTGHRLTP